MVNDLFDIAEYKNIAKDLGESLCDYLCALGYDVILIESHFSKEDYIFLIESGDEIINKLHIVEEQLNKINGASKKVVAVSDYSFLVYMKNNFGHLFDIPLNKTIEEAIERSEELNKTCNRFSLKDLDYEDVLQKGIELFSDYSEICVASETSDNGNNTLLSEIMGNSIIIE